MATKDSLPPLIYSQMVAVMRDVGAVEKSRQNQVQRYSFRGVDDVYQALHEILGRHGIITVPTVLEDRSEERTTAKNSTLLIYRVLKIQYRFYAEDGSYLDAVVIGEGMDSGDKATNKAMSVAHKYALLQVFTIPTAEAKDPENPGPVDEGLTSPGFNPKRSDHMNALRSTCHVAGIISEESVQKVAMRMIGKQSEQLASIIEEVKRESR